MFQRLAVLVTLALISVSLTTADEGPSWQSWVKAGAPALPSLLKQLETANPTKANILRTAADAIVENELAAGRKLDVAGLQAFLKDQKNNPRSRRMVFEWLCKTDPTFKEQWTPAFINDPSLELRRDAVAAALAKLPKEGDRKAGLRTILASTRDRDQVDAIAKELKGLGDEFDLAAHFGFVRNWTVLSTFDNTEEKGFAAVYEPEKKLDWNTLPTGKDKKPTEWKKLTSTDPYGKIDLAKGIGKHKSAIAYAVTIVKADSETKVDLRANSLNALKVWLNGKEVIAHEEYHHGDNMDQYIGQGTLQPGENIIMVKVCQNDQKEQWAQSWEFALRVCDNLGTAVKLEVVPTPVK
jgi:hypothetical protein